MGIVRNGFEKLDSWMFNGTDHRLVEISKGLAVSAAVTAVLIPAITAPFYYIANKNESELKEKFARFDVRPTTVFNSVLQCAKRGHSQQECEQSQAVALDIANSLITPANYNSQVACSKSYNSPMVAWQVLRSNISDAAPLYSCGEKGTAVRADGQRFKLD